MRYTTLRLGWDDTELHPLTAAFTDDAGVTIESLHYVNSVDDGGYTELSRLRGDLDAARDILGSIPEVRAFDISAAGIAYIHYESSPLMDRLLAVVFDHAVVLTWPVTFARSNGNLSAQLTLLGTEDALSRAIATIPAEIDVSLVRTGRYEASAHDPLSSLTDRQREVLDVAVRAGYYEVPREATHRDIAAELSVAPGTVSEHLQRIEANLVSALVGAPGTDGEP
ncbi:helix-turn-helix domain-containing protein [Haloferax larsenii]|uniref:HTH DNA binding domain-containing protein n=1 Tax=Haloferax larsenii TaxID=302484 RepID=A0A1H7FVF3_HALLR|nr:helix-turn-helix domain-containing protein [Haloferax larsenii]SEK29929.1 HTH DNA binding domain-containing protein [Haloferax larsenii]